MGSSVQGLLALLSAGPFPPMKQETVSIRCDRDRPVEGIAVARRQKSQHFFWLAEVHIDEKSVCPMDCSHLNCWTSL